MTRRRRWVLGTLGALALGAGLLAWDTDRRLRRALEGHERRVAAELAALRARHASKPSLYGREGWERLTRTLDALRPGDPAVALNDAGLFHPYETDRRRGLRYRPDAAPPPESRRPKGPATYAGLCDSLGLVYEVKRGGGLEGIYMWQDEERRFVGQWHEIAAKEGNPSAAALRVLHARLDDLERARPPLTEALAAEPAMDRAFLLALCRDGIDLRESLKQPPGWRDFFSWRVVLIRALNRLEDHGRELAVLEVIPLRDRPATALSVLRRSIEKEDGLGGALLEKATRVLEDEVEFQAEWALLRTSMAVARFRAERGRLPRSLEEVVPDYAPRLPVCVLTGRPLRFSAGRVWSEHASLAAWRAADP